MKILFLTDNFPPEYNAPATRTFEHCREWVRLGAEVTVITCAPNFPSGKVFGGYKNRWKQVEMMDGIRVVRVWSFVTANSGFFKRTLDFISFAVTSFLAGLTIKTDLIVATSPQFFTAVSGCALGIFRRKKWVMEVRDIWPESIVAVDAVKSNAIIELLERVEVFLYGSAFKIVVVTDAFKDNLISKNVPPEKIYVIKNGVELKAFEPRPKDEKILHFLGLNGKFVVGYVGTHGLAHSLDFILRCLVNVSDSSFHFLFIGDGAEKRKLVELAQRLELKNVTFIDPVKKSDIALYLSVLDVALVPLKKSTTFESVIPSKIFESVAMNIPILLGVDGESRQIIETFGAGLFFEPENEQDFLSKLVVIRQKKAIDQDRLTQACSSMAAFFDRRNLAKEMLRIISDSH